MHHIFAMKNLTVRIEAMNQHLLAEIDLVPQVGLDVETFHTNVFHIVDFVVKIKFLKNFFSDRK